MNFLEELEWRGMIQNTTPDVDELLRSEEPVTGYIGFDPTAPSMTIGNYVQIMLLTLFQKSGHKPIVLMGGATGRIGDPSFKEEERDLKTYDELDRNLAFQIEQMKQFLEFDAGKKTDALIVNNLDFYKNMNVLEFLRSVGKNITVSYMTAKESVKKRMETGLSFTEFTYQLIQGNDFLELLNNYNCQIQMGGSDQWGNITTGIEFIRRNASEKAYAVTTPLLTKTDGSKFGKSEQGNIWLDSKLTSPYEFYQFWINASDDDLPKFVRYFTFKTKEEVEALEKEYADNPNQIKRILAEELTTRIHGKEAFEVAKKVSNILFNKRASREELLDMDESALSMVAQQIPSYTLQNSDNLQIDELLTSYSDIFSSKSELRRAIQGNSLSINKVKVQSHEDIIDNSEFLHDRFVLIEHGKKKKYILEKK